MFWDQIANGISLGMVYALIAIGYSIVFSVLQMMNFAHGDIYTMGTFVSFALLEALHVNMAVSILLSLLVGAVLAALVELCAFRPLRKEDFTFSMVTVLGAGYVIRNGAERIWGSGMKFYPNLTSGEAIHLWGWKLSSSHVLIMVISIGLLVAFYLFLNYTKYGQAVLCMAQDITTASLMGIRINRMASLLYAIGGALGVVGGILYSATYNVIHVGMAFSGTMVAYTAAIVGGVGSLLGAALGGLIIGISQEVFAAYVSSAYRDVITYIILIIVLLVRPTGLIKARTGEKM
jgi:branched-chain amino acid transport system permease protein